MFKAAVEWKLATVTPEWIYQSVELNAAQDVASYPVPASSDTSNLPRTNSWSSASFIGATPLSGDLDIPRTTTNKSQDTSVSSKSNSSVASLSSNGSSDNIETLAQNSRSARSNSNDNIQARVSTSKAQTRPLARSTSSSDAEIESSCQV